MEKIRARRTAKREKPYFPKLRSQYGAKHSFRFSVRAWLNFKLYFITLLVLAALAVAVVFVLPAAELNTENLLDTFYTYDENVAETKATDASANGAANFDTQRTFGNGAIALLAEETPCEHVWGTAEAKVVQEATCTQNGITNMVKTCTKCGAEDVQVIDTPATGHIFEVVEKITKKATCTEEGELTITKSCVNCDEKIVETKTIAKTPHTPEAQLKVEEEKATCTADGWKKHYEVCKDCGHETLVKTEVVLKATHVPADKAVILDEGKVAPTCTNAGSHVEVVRCTVCDAEISRTTVTDQPLGHKISDTKIKEETITPAVGCTVSGTKRIIYICTVCGEEADRKTVIIPAGHTPGSEVKENEVEKTCITDGSYDLVVYCTACDDGAGNPFEISRRSVTVQHTGHTLSTIVTDNHNPTCTDPGYYYNVTTCKNVGCGFETAARVEVAELGHQYPYCTDISCGRCGEIRVPKSHQYSRLNVVTVYPTCTTAGYVEYYPDYCSVCNYTPTDLHTESLDMLDHVYDYPCDPACNACGAAPFMILHTAAAPVTCVDDSVCAYCNTVLVKAVGSHVRNNCREEICLVCLSSCEAVLHVDANGDHYCDVPTCMQQLREFNWLALIYWILLPLLIIAAAFFLGLNVYMLVKAVKVSTMRVEIYDEVIAWKWGLFFKRHTEKRFVGVYDVLVMPRNKCYYKDKVEKRRPRKYGTVLAKVPGGGYEWNLKFFGVKEYVLLKNYLESRKIGERYELPRTNFHDDAT